MPSTPTPRARRRISQAAAIVLAAIIGAITTIIVSRRQAEHRDDDITEIRRTIQVQAARIDTLNAAERQKEATIDDLRRQLEAEHQRAASSASGSSNASEPSAGQKRESTTTPASVETAGSPTSTTPPPQPAQYIQGFEITRPACTWSGGRVNCYFRVTNTDPGRRYIQLIMDAGSSARSYLVDNSGRRYYANAMTFAGDGPGFERFIGEKLESGVPTAAGMGFEATEKPAGPVVLVLIVGTVNNYPVVFRDLAIGP